MDITTIYTTYFTRLVHRASIAGEDAPDCVQDVFVHLLEHPVEIRNPIGYLGVAVYRRALDRAKRPQSIPLPELPAEVEDNDLVMSLLQRWPRLREYVDGNPSGATREWLSKHRMEIIQWIKQSETL